MIDTINPVGVLSFEQAVTALQRLSFTPEEAIRCLLESDKYARYKITKAVQDRVKKEQGK
uniref:Uncharacterized protein n=1 Tax=viral metagenome TaxID=1070528 RepID=A0A6M3Y2Y2_9ZZZZ